MIGQIDIEKTLQLQPNKECLFVSLATVLNHVVDAVNELQVRSENVQPVAETRSENVQDKFAQYRDWAGKLCRFWDKDKDRAIYDILEEVIADWSYQFKTKSNYIFYHCEPVKPDDDIIYKGGDNE